MSGASRSGLGIKGEVRVIRMDAHGRVLSDETYHNTATDWARAVLAQLILTPPNQESGAVLTSRPLYISLGTGTGTASHTDLAMFAEVYNTRRAFSYSSQFQGFAAQMTVAYQTTDPSGTYTEAGLWDANVTTTTLASAVTAGAKSITLANGTPALYGSTVPGQYNTLYINDSTNPEYASIAQTVSAGATTLTLQNGLQYAHASGTQVVLFSGNLWGHVTFPQAVTKGQGEQLVIQWTVYLQAV